MPGFWENIFGSAPRFEEKQLFNPQQQGLQGSLIQQLMAVLGGQGGNNPMSQQLERNFQTNVIPSLAERFTSLGGGAQNSSAFQGALGSAAGNLQQDLAAQQYGQLQNLLGYAFQPQSERFAIPGQEGLLGQVAPAALGAVGTFFGGPAGGLAGSAGGTAISKLLSALFQQQQPVQSELNQGSYPQFQQFQKPQSSIGQPNRNSMFNNMSGGMFNPMSRPY